MSDEQLSAADIRRVCRFCKASLRGPILLSRMHPSGSPLLSRLVELGFLYINERKGSVDPTKKAFALWTAAEGEGTQ